MPHEETFATAVNCMDGRAQEPVRKWIQQRFGVFHVDMVTEAGPSGILARGEPEEIVRSIFHRVDISIEKHGSRVVAVVGHHDCAGNPVDAHQQKQHIVESVRRIRAWREDVTVIGLYVNHRWEVEEVVSFHPSRPSVQAPREGHDGPDVSPYP